EPPPPQPGPDAPAPDPLGDALHPAPGGLTPADAARHASGSSRVLAAKRAEIEAAAAKVDQSLVAFFPILTLSATYTRLSKVDSKLDLGLPPGTPGIPEGGFALESPLNSYQLAASLVVPLTDYVLRLTQAYAAASESTEAKRLEARAQELKDEGDAKTAYLNWIRAKGRRVVAELAVKQAQAHIEDARVALAAGVGTRADVLRLEAQVAAAQQLVAATAAYEALGEEQLHMLMHDDRKQPLAVGIDVMKDPSAGQDPPLEELVQIALSRRVELQALEANVRALESSRSVLWAGHLPRIDAFADLLYANPNPRVFASGEDGKWVGTWDVGVRLTWRVNDTFTALGSTSEVDSNLAALRARAEALRDGVVLEVTAAYYDKRRARASINAALAREQAGEEGLRLRRMQLRAGKAKAADIVDAETELTRSRLDRLDAHVDLLAAGVRLEYAMGGPADASAPGGAIAPLR
ncbi:MAG: TolC family protein, partial [Myxococcales bacterium]|nr:TolC family protein [Myxococcales bacterium]